jgi:hypothetical protein
LILNSDHAVVFVIFVKPRTRAHTPRGVLRVRCEVAASLKCPARAQKHTCRLPRSFNADCDQWSTARSTCGFSHPLLFSHFAPLSLSPALIALVITMATISLPRSRQIRAIAMVIVALVHVSVVLLLLDAKGVGTKLTNLLLVGNTHTSRGSPSSSSTEKSSIVRLDWTNGSKQQQGTRKSTLILHSGPHKMGTTFLQCVLQSDRATSLLEQDRYVYLGKFNSACGLSNNNHEFGYAKNIMLNATHIHPSFVETMQSIHQQGNDAIIVTESWHPLQDEQYRILARTLQSDWTIQHVVVYRPLYEWIPSFYSEVFRPLFRPKYNWDGSGGKTWAEIPPMTLTPDNEWTYGLYYMLRVYRSHPTRQVMDRLTRLLPSSEPLTVIHLNNLPVLAKDVVGDSYLVHFLCNVVPNAHQSCHAAQITVQMSHVKKPNPSYHVDADRLASAAVRLGLVSPTKDRTVITTRTKQALEAWIAAASKTNQTATFMNDKWRTCPAKQHLDGLLALSMELEEQVLERWLTEDEQKRHMSGFQQYVIMGKFCALNVEQLLKQVHWKRFFAKI